MVGKNGEDFDATIENESDAWAQIAVQGPASSEVLSKVLDSTAVNS